MQYATTQFVNAGIVGDIFDVRAATVIKWAKDGKIPFTKLPSGRYVFNVDDVRESLLKQPDMTGFVERRVSA